MADATVAHPISDFGALPIPPLDASFFSDDFNFSVNNFMSFEDNDDVLNFDFNFDDISLPSDTEDFVNSTFSDPIPANIPPSNATAPEFCQFSGDPSFNGAGFINLPSSDYGERSSVVVPKVFGDGIPDDAGYLKVSSSDSRDCSQESGNKHLGDSRVLNYVSPEVEVQNREFSGPGSSQGSDNCAQSVGCSPNSVNTSINQRIEFEDLVKCNLMKRKKENDDADSAFKRSIKYRKSNAAAGSDKSYVVNETNDEEGKRKARLMRNRESAQLSRQRKKHYVEELEGKVRAMHSTIQDLNAKISYIVAENATLRQQMNGVGVVGPPPMPGMYPHPPMAPMGYPWVPYSPYVVKPQGSQVPLVPIPKLKQQQPDKANKKRASKKTEGKSKTKKVASVSFLGLLFFILLFGGLVPMVNVKYGGMRNTISGESDYNVKRFYNQHHGSKVLMVNGSYHDSGTRLSNKNFDAWKNNNNTLNCGSDHVGGAESNIKQSSSEEFARSGNASEPLVASLYVPRNDKLVKIDGNLIIQSVLASEKAMTSLGDGETKSGRETSLAVPYNLAAAVSVPGVGQTNGRHPRLYRSAAEQQRALASGSEGKNNLKSTPADGKLQQWFREGLAGPMLSSGMCTEVFRFDVSPTPGAIFPATSVGNISVQENQNPTHLYRGRNRRILHGLPIPLAGSANNISEENAGTNSQKESAHRNCSLSPMVVSVLVDPREVGKADGDGIMGTKSLPRIFVVVLLDSVKYVTYSCMLPFKGPSHLVTA